MRKCLSYRCLSKSKDMVLINSCTHIKESTVCLHYIRDCAYQIKGTSKNME